MTQQETVLNHLKKKPITCWDAIVNYRITRLPVLIQRLKMNGYYITTEIKDGENTRYAKYTLEKK
jgi:hypothetical protein